MSDEVAAKQATLEEKRRAARRARILGSSDSRLGAICGLVGSTHTGGASDTGAAGAAEESHQHTPISGSDSDAPASSYDPKVLPLLSEVPSIPEPSTMDASNANKATITRSSNSEPKIRSTASTNTTAFPSDPSALIAAMKEQNTAPPKGNELKRKQALVVGVLLALVLAIVEIKFAKYATTARTAFWALDMLMWVGVFATATDSLPPTLNLLFATVLPATGEKGEIIKKGLSQAIGWTKAVYHVLQDWLVAQFFTILYAAIKARI